MKKAFALMAASAVAVSMFAFAGCGEPKTDEGAIPGNYEEKTPEQITEIVDKIDTDKIFGDPDTTNPDAASMNMGLKVNLEGGFAMGEMLNANGTVVLDYKMTANESAAAGVGSMSVKGNYMSMMTGTKTEQSIDFSGNAYNDTQWVYAASGEDKIKINMDKLMEIVGGGSDGGDTTITPASLYAAEDVSSIQSLLAMAQVLNIKVSVDDTDGFKFKFSASEETIWAALSMVADEIDLTAAQITTIKSMVVFNTFKFDVYFSLDKDSNFVGASTVIDIDLKMDPSLLTQFMADGETAEVPEITAKIKGSVEIYTHNDTVTVPDTVTGGDYTDMTDTIIAMIGNMM